MPHHVNWTERAQALKADGRAVIDGQRVAAVDGQTFAKHSPIDGRKLLDVARGLANYASSEARLIARKASTEIEAVLGFANEPELIHRDNLVLA